MSALFLPVKMAVFGKSFYSPLCIVRLALQSPNCPFCVLGLKLSTLTDGMRRGTLLNCKLVNTKHQSTSKHKSTRRNVVTITMMIMIIVVILDW